MVDSAFPLAMGGGGSFADHREWQADAFEPSRFSELATARLIADQQAVMAVDKGGKELGEGDFASVPPAGANRRARRAV